MQFECADCIAEWESLLKTWLFRNPNVDVSEPFGCRGEAGKCMCGHQRLERMANHPDADDRRQWELRTQTLEEDQGWR